MAMAAKELDTWNWDYECGKCGSTDFYKGTIKVKMGNAIFADTRDVQTAMCRKCDIQMNQIAKAKDKAETKEIFTGFWIVTLGFVVIALLIAIYPYLK